MSEFIEYQSHKRVHARPMARGEYNAYRNWTMPAGEDPEDAGYLVIYNMGTADHYESWSPKKQLDEGYTVYQSLPEKLTPELVESVVEAEEYFESGLMTICTLTLTNGFKVVGKAACANPAIYCPVKGKQYAREDAAKQIWDLEGYLLKQRMHGQA